MHSSISIIINNYKQFIETIEYILKSDERFSYNDNMQSAPDCLAECKINSSNMTLFIKNINCYVFKFKDCVIENIDENNNKDINSNSHFNFNLNELYHKTVGLNIKTAIIELNNSNLKIIDSDNDLISVDLKIEPIDKIIYPFRIFEDSLYDSNSIIDMTQVYNKITSQKIPELVEILQDKDYISFNDFIINHDKIEINENLGNYLKMYIQTSKILPILSIFNHKDVMVSTHWLTTCRFKMVNEDYDLYAECSVY